MSIYSKKFYEGRDVDTLYSSQAILKSLFGIVMPQSVVDFGCGVGTWLKTSKELGVPEVLGIEGDWVSVDDLMINVSEFRHENLAGMVTLSRKYDLAISLEVAEHISMEYADVFVENLVRASDIIMFSAAIPNQRGNGHVNEQWPEYWIAKFLERNYIVLDLIRPKIWNDEKIKTWYKQNIFVFVKKEIFESRSDLIRMAESQSKMFSVVHPSTFLRQVELSHPRHFPLVMLVLSLPKIFWEKAIRLFLRKK